MGLPLAGITLGAALLKGLFGAKQKKDQAGAQRKAQEEEFAAKKAAHVADEKARGGRLDAARGVAANVQGSLGAGAPDYTLDPSAFAAIRAERPFSGSMPADPRSGLGAALLSGLFGGVGDTAETMLLGRMMAGDSTGAGQGAAPQVDTLRQFDICKLRPTTPGCQSSGHALVGAR